MNPEKLQYGNYYHIYSHGVGMRDVFKDQQNYEYFLQLVDKYITPIADIYAWVLMPNHVHFALRVKTEQEVDAFATSSTISDRVYNPVRDCGDNKGNGKNKRPLKIGSPSQQFSKLFNAYAQAYNKWVKSRGALFERPFKRKVVNNTQYLKQLILYVHNNPVHHGFCDHALDYPWSSYLTCISIKPTKLKRDQVIGWFDNHANFKTKHDQDLDLISIEKWLEL